MISLLRTIKSKSALFLFSGLLVFAISSCNKRSYPCPGLGQSNEADLSMFDESGKLKDDGKGGRMDKKTGLVKKKKPKKLNARRKTHI